MLRVVVAGIAVSVLAGLAPPATAYPPNATDQGCTLVTASDPNTGPGVQTGVLQGGPIRQDGTLTCTVKVGVSTHAGTTPNYASASATGTNGVTVLPFAVVSFTAFPDTPVYVCEQFRAQPEDVTYYWDDASGSWTTQSTASCALAIAWGTTDPVFDPAFELLDLVDPLVCSLLLPLHPLFYPSDPVYVAADGDLYLLGLRVYDCGAGSEDVYAAGYAFNHALSTL